MQLDYGIFQCVASNPAGNIQAAALLTVKHPGKGFLNYHNNREGLV